MGRLQKKLQVSSQKKLCQPKLLVGLLEKNPISIIIPCHRVIASNGDLRGYSAGLDKKLQLLRLEGLNIDEKLRVIV